MGKLFGTDGIRGPANEYPMNGETAFQVGQAVTLVFRKRNPHPRIVIGKDTRISGFMLERALEAGISSMGGTPCTVGVLPTPGIAYITKKAGADAGIVISASHNPFEDNGIKVFSGKGFKLSDDQEAFIEDLILKNRLQGRIPSQRELGKGCVLQEAPGDYVSFLKTTFPEELSMKGMKIVLDTANGATSVIAPRVFRELGADIRVIFHEPDGTNINDQCGSQYTETLERTVKKENAEIGVAFDGDGDRMIAVDENGQTLTGDQILFVCAKTLKDQDKLKNDMLITTVMSNLGLKTACRKNGIRHHESQVGDRHVLEMMQTKDAAVGGEDSGHMIFLDHHTTGDGILAALKLIASMIWNNKPLSTLASKMDVFPQELMNISVINKPEIDSIIDIKTVINNIENELADRGRVLVRYSGTQNMCRVMVEGPTRDETVTFCRQIADVVKKCIGS